jgi:hypothetical protein
MPERASIFQVVQVGVESTPGTAVTATKKLTGLQIEPGVQAEIKRYRPTGYKFGTVAALTKEWTEASIRGPLTYTEIVYLLSSLMGTATPVNGSPTAAKIWTFNVDSDGADTPKTFTVEQGSAERAHRFAYGLVTGLTLSFNNDGAEVSGSMIGKALQDGFTLTGGATEVALAPVTRPQVIVKLADTMAGLGAAAALSRVVSAEWTLENRFAPVWVLNGASDWPAHVEVEPTGSAKLMLEADAEGMGLLTTMRANAMKFMRIQATGAQIGVGPATYSVQVDCAVKVTEVSPFSDQDGIFAIEWGLELQHDATAGYATRVTVVNELAAL